MSGQQTDVMSHKERLLKQGTKHFYLYGYHGTTVDSVLEAAGVPKGSFYHYFGSKEAFGQAVLDRYLRFQLDRLKAWIGRPGLSTSQQLAGFFDELAQELIGSGYQRSCLAGKFAAEVAATSEAFRIQVGSGLNEWRETLLAALSQGQDRGDVRRDLEAEDLADAFLAMVQGALIIVLASRDERSLHAVSRVIPTLIAP